MSLAWVILALTKNVCCKGNKELLKVSPFLQAMKALMESRGIALLCF
jgi:hypothetical protein